MYKKTYISLLIIGTFLVVSILPLFNYSVDRWRVLHSDYSHYYAGQAPNKTFLKTKYLIEHPNKAKTLLMGSSNNGYINANLIKKDAYNMKYNFGLLAIHLQNLKTMIKKGVKIDTLWVGINDYIIWKNPKDYEKSFERSTYQADFWKDFQTYMFYLFRKPEIMDLYLFQGKYTLLNGDIITDPHPHTEAKKREDEHRRHLDKWKAHMLDIKPTLLRYDDTVYRIDKAISEITELKILCKSNDIDLTLFMYPVFYKAYLEYNQNKIDEFKKKLAQVMPFHDFYRLNKNAYTAIKWQDSMHFSYSMGNFIVKSIKENKFLVTKKNINKHIDDIHIEAKDKIGAEEGLFIVHPSLNILANKTIFDIKDKDTKYYMNNDMVLKMNHGNIQMIVTGSDPILILDHLDTVAQKVFLTLKIKCNKKTTFNIFYKDDINSEYNQSHIFTKALIKGENSFCIVVPKKYIDNKLRIDFVDKQGIYTIKEFKIFE